MELEFEQRFDIDNMLQYVNNEPSVMHCHHYTTLFIDLAFKTQKLKGKELLTESMEEAFFLVLKKYYITHFITSIEDKIKIAEQYYSSVGMGQIVISAYQESGGEAILTRSHVEEGWLKKFGKSVEFVDLITPGYLSGLFSLAYNKQLRFYSIRQTSSIAKGESSTRFVIKAGSNNNGSR